MMGCATPTLAQINEEETVEVTNYQGKKENIDLPASMTQELDSLMNLYNAKMHLKADSDCNLPDVNPVYDQEVYKERLAHLPTVIEMPYNDIVQKFIDRYSSDLRRKVAYMLGAQNFLILNNDFFFGATYKGEHKGCNHKKPCKIARKSSETLFIRI